MVAVYGRVLAGMKVIGDHGAVEMPEGRVVSGGGGHPSRGTDVTSCGGSCLVVVSYADADTMLGPDLNMTCRGRTEIKLEHRAG